MSLTNLYYVLRRKLGDIWRAIRWFPRNVARLINYLPLIWNDRDWDHSFFFRMMRHKLQRMEKRMALGITGSGKRDAERIHICVLLLDRILADNYHENAELQHRQRWGECSLTFELIPDREGLYTSRFNYPNVKTPLDEEQQRKEFKQVMTHANYMAGQDMEYLFNIIRKHVNGWWD